MIAVRPSNRVDQFYLSDEWKRLRTQTFKRDAFTCVIVGCGQRAVIADHRIPRRHGGLDALDNLRSLCRHHDALLKEAPDGSRLELQEVKTKIG